MLYADRLNLACGTDIKPNWLNVDHLPLPGVDKQVNLFEFPWPFLTQHFNYVLASHILEHVPRGPMMIRFMEELHRITSPVGVIEIRTPHPSIGEHIWKDPTHTGIILPSFFDYFSDNGATPKFYTTARFKLLSQKVTGWRAPFNEKLRIRKIGLTQHLYDRVPPFRMFRRPAEMTYLLAPNHGF